LPKLKIPVVAATIGFGIGSKSRIHNFFIIEAGDKAFKFWDGKFEFAVRGLDTTRRQWSFLRKLRRFEWDCAWKRDYHKKSMGEGL
jgi:hypothetical protein